MIKFQVECRKCGEVYAPCLLSVKESAAYLQVSEGTISRWRKEGWLKYSRVGRGNYYQHEDLDRCYQLRGYDRANNETVEVILR